MSYKRKKDSEEDSFDASDELQHDKVTKLAQKDQGMIINSRIMDSSHVLVADILRRGP
jgi:hypothetical protein